MQTTMEEAGKHTVKLTVEVPPEEFAKDLDRTYRSIANSVKVPGFRKGKVPRRIIDAQIGRDAVLAEFLQDAVPEYYSRAVREHQLAPIADPEIDLDDEELSEERPLRFTATVEVRPRLELKPEDYMGVHVDLDPAVVEEDEVDRFVDRLRERFAELEPVSRPATKGDFVVMDLRTTLHGQELPEATREDYLYEVGSGDIVAKLDDELEGKRSGDIVRFNETLPDGAGEHAGQEVSFTVLLKEVKAKKLPAADDAFATTASEFDTLEELRTDLRAKLQDAKERQQEQELRDKVLQAMVDTVDVDLPERLIDHEVEHRVAHAEERAQQVGATLDQVLEAQGWDELRFRSDARDHAVRAVKADLVLEAVARAEDLQVSPEELGREVGALARAMNRDPREVAKTLEKSGQITSLAGDIIRSKALDLLVEHAEVPGGNPLKRVTDAADDEAEETGGPQDSEQGERDE